MASDITSTATSGKGFQVIVLTSEGESSPCNGHDLRFGEIRFLTPNTLVLAYNQSLHLRVESDGIIYEIADARVESVNGVDGQNCYDCEIVRMDGEALSQHHKLLCQRGFPPENHKPGGDRKRVPMSAGAGWPHLRESVMMLNLAVAQIESSMEDGERSVGELTQSFFHLSENLKSVYSELNELDAAGQQDERKQGILQRMAGLQGHVSQAIMAFQFYDKLSQRLAHISKSLSDMARLVSDVSRVDDTEQWRELKDKIKKSYSIEEEHALFEAILAGEDVHDAIKRITRERAEQARKQAEEPDIELF
jgi:hypothetical protein